MAEFSATPRSDKGYRWTRDLTRYHWWILIICSLGWLFDTMDQRIFSLARSPAMRELIGKDYEDSSRESIVGELEELKMKYDPADDTDTLRGALVRHKSDDMGRFATTIFIIGWATGGILFGILGDKWGRARTMMLTILIYAGFTALSGLSRSVESFMAYRFLTGLGVGGEFSAGVALLSEVIPERPRPYALGLLQGLSAVGNMIGATVSMFLLAISWRYLFFFGAIPALLVVVTRSKVKEPDTWIEAKKRSQKGGSKTELGSFRDLFGIPRWRKNALVGATLAVVGVTGLWGMGFYSPELLGHVLQGLDEKTIAQRKSLLMFCQDIGAFFSMYGFAVLSQRIGRKPTFHIACILGMISIIVVFGFLNSADIVTIVLMGMLLGFGTLAMFGGYAVYFPELFPTRLRSTGVSFCYNVGRYLASAINLIPLLVYRFYSHSFEGLAAFRATAITMAGLYLVGNIALFFAPETQGKPLPTEDEDLAAA